MKWGLRAQAYYAPERRALDKALAADIAALVPVGGVVSVELSSSRSDDMVRLDTALRRLRVALPEREVIVHCPTPRLDRRWFRTLRRAIGVWTADSIMVSAVVLGNEPNAPSTWNDASRYAWWLDSLGNFLAGSDDPSWVLPALSFVGQGSEGDYQNPMGYAQALLDPLEHRELFGAWAVNAYEDLTYLGDLVAGLRGMLDVPVWITEWGVPVGTSDADLAEGAAALEASGAEVAIYYVHHLHADAGGTQYGLREYLPSGRSHYTAGDATALWQPVATMLQASGG